MKEIKQRWEIMLYELLNLAHLDLHSIVGFFCFHTQLELLELLWVQPPVIVMNPSVHLWYCTFWVVRNGDAEIAGVKNAGVEIVRVDKVWQAKVFNWYF